MRHGCRHIATIIFICCTSLLVAACSTKYPNLQKLSPLPEEGVCRVAVLPFNNQSSYRDGNTLFYRVFVSELARLGNFALATEGDVRDAFRQVRVNPGYQSPTYDQMRIIGEYLNVDVLVTGSINQMGESVSEHMENETVPFLTVNLKLIEVISGRTFWSIYHRRSGEEYRKVMHFGLISTTTQIADQVSKDIIAHWASEGFIGKCTE